MEVVEALALAREIVGTPQWELLAVVPAQEPRISPGGATVYWEVKACYHTEASRWNVAFTVRSRQEWAFVRGTQPARMARQVALIQARRPYLPGGLMDVREPQASVDQQAASEKRSEIADVANGAERADHPAHTGRSGDQPRSSDR